MIKNLYSEQRFHVRTFLHLSQSVLNINIFLLSLENIHQHILWQTPHNLFMCWSYLLKRKRTNRRVSNWWCNAWVKEWFMQCCLVQNQRATESKKVSQGGKLLSNWALRAFIERWHTGPRCCQFHWWETSHTSPPIPADEACHTNRLKGRQCGVGCHILSKYLNAVTGYSLPKE